MSQENEESDPQAETLDLLIEQSRRLLEVYEARASTADTKIAGVVTAAVALATITVTAATTANHVNEVLALAVVVFLVLSVLCALLGRSFFGLHRRHSNGHKDANEPKMPLLSSESPEYRNALQELRDCRADERPIQVRQKALAVWRAREADTQRTARARERAAAVAGSLLGVALVCAGILGYLIIANG